jgi:fido (protein-threonine AMPylation protein)
MPGLPQPNFGSGQPNRPGRPSRASYHQRLEEGLRELERVGGLPSPTKAARIWTQIWYDEAHNSTALEGNTLVMREVEALLRDGKVVGQKPFKDYLEVRGYAKAAEWVYRQGINPGGWGGDKLLSLTEVRQVHREVLTPVWEVVPDPEATPEEGPGSWRRHDIKKFSRGMKPPDWTQVPALVQDWVDDVTHITPEQAPIAETLALKHAAFERIHPFFDGNGRTGRLLMNLVLVRLAFPPTIIRLRDRDRYLAALHKADRGDAGPLGELVARGIYENITRFILPALAGEMRLVPLDALADSDLSLSALRGAAERGRLKVVMGSDRVWRSSKKWVAEYRKSRWATLRAPRGPRRAKQKQSDSGSFNVSWSAKPQTTGHKSQSGGGS